MAYLKPTLSELIDQIETNLFSRFPDLDPSLATSMAKNIAEVIAGAVNGTYGNLEYNLEQQFPDTAQEEYATRWAAIYGLTRLVATSADGDAIFTGSIGSSVTTSAELVSSDGIVYEVDTGFTLAAESETHSVTAQDAGEDGNIDADAELAFVSVPSGMDSIATVDSGGITGGTDQETDVELTARTLTKIANPPRGGAAHDYTAWAKEATNVTRTWVRTPDSPGTDTVDPGEVLLWFAMDNDYDDGIPQSGDITDVQDYIDAVRPVMIDSGFTADAPTAYEIDFDVTISPDTPTNQTNTTAELALQIRESGEVGGTIATSDIYEAMSRVPTLTNWTVNSTTALSAGIGELHTMGGVTFS